MDLGAAQLFCVAWFLESVLALVCVGVTVTHKELKLCEEDERVCVSDLRDCGAHPPSSLQQNLNMSCYYQQSADETRSISCEWSEELGSHSSDVSLTFSRRNKVISCQGIFNPLAVFSVTARIKNPLTGTEIWSRPQTVSHPKEKPFPPVVTVLASTHDSLVVSWKSNTDGNCQLRHRPSRTPAWTQVPDFFSIHSGQNLNFSITGLSPFTEYRCAVACRGDSGIWSDWSSDVRGKTLDKEPSRLAELCYRLEETTSREALRLHLVWKAANPQKGEGRVLWYELSVEPGGQTRNITETTALLVVKEGNYSASVRGFNTACSGPTTHLQINTQRRSNPPSVRNLWVISCYPENRTLQVEWEISAAVSHVIIQLRSDASPSTSRWLRVHGSTTSAGLPDVEADESYQVAVFPIQNQQCGPARSLSASLPRGALIEAVGLTVVRVTEAEVTVKWAWQPKSGPIRVSRYMASLRGDPHSRAWRLFPDENQHTFVNLTPNTEYTVLLLADSRPVSYVAVKTDLSQGPGAVVIVTPLLLAVALLILSVLSRTVFRSLCLPPVSSPRGSTAGLWLMNSGRQMFTGSILDTADFQVTEALAEKTLCSVDLSVHRPSEEDLDEDFSPAAVSSRHAQLPALSLFAAQITEETAKRPHQREYDLCRSQEDEEGCPFPEVLLDGFCGGLMTETLGGGGAGGQSCSPLMCETEYLSNSCFQVETEDQSDQSDCSGEPVETPPPPNKPCDADFQNTSGR
uniref:Fibronectin type-III domain-containing protein n=1 Tax=Oryzias latipes TaxID=8090 RepID=A0A3P9HEL1_ORYLA